jgi:hypothetical protein
MTPRHRSTSYRVLIASAYGKTDANNQDLSRNHFPICMQGASSREVPVEKRISCEVTSGENHIYR